MFSVGKQGIISFHFILREKVNYNVRVTVLYDDTIEYFQSSFLLFSFHCFRNISTLYNLLQLYKLPLHMCTDTFISGTILWKSNHLCRILSRQTDMS